MRVIFIADILNSEVESPKERIVQGIKLFYRCSQKYPAVIGHYHLTPDEIIAFSERKPIGPKILFHEHKRCYYFSTLRLINKNCLRIYNKKVAPHNVRAFISKYNFNLKLS